MALYEAQSIETLLYQYRKDGCFSGDKIFNNKLEGLAIPGVLFSNVDIENSTLVGADLSEMHSDGLNVRQSDLKEILFRGSKQQYSIFIDSYLIKGNFTDSHLYNLRFKNCIAHSLAFRGSRLVGSVFSECEMFRGKFDGALLMRVSFDPGRKGDLAGLFKASFDGAFVVDCSFKKMNLNRCSIAGAVFVNCDFTGTRMEEVDIEQGSFISCNLDKAILDVPVAPSGQHESPGGTGAMFNCF